MRLQGILATAILIASASVSAAAIRRQDDSFPRPPNTPEYRDCFLKCGNRYSLTKPCVPIVDHYIPNPVPFCELDPLDRLLTFCRNTCHPLE